MARSKRTDRAEARRRYRAYLAEMELGEAEGSEAEEGSAVAARPAGRAAAEGASVRRPGQRMGFFPAMKAAMRPVHYLDDLRYAPRLITGSPAVWLPTAIAIACAAVAISRLHIGNTETVRNDMAVQITIGFVLSPFMPMLPGLIAGFFAPRASWLAGVIVAFVTTIAYGVVASQRPELFWEDGGTLGAGGVAVKTLYLMTLSLPLGAVLAAFSAWYKRFLELTGPGASLSAQRSAAQKQRPSSRRR